MSDYSGSAERKKTSNRPFIDVFVVLFCLAGATSCLYLFYQDLYSSFRSSSEAQTGIVVVRQNIVHRRLNDRLTWDRLFTDTPVYNGDVIRVARLSGAELNIADSSIGLGENTLIRIQKDIELLKIDFYSGEIKIASASGGTPVLLSLGDSVVEAAPGAVFSASSGDDGAVLRITEGKAYIIQEGKVSPVLTAAPDNEIIIMQEKASGRLAPVSAQEAQKRQEEIQTQRQILQQEIQREIKATQEAALQSAQVPNEALRENLSQQEKADEPKTAQSAPELVTETENDAAPTFVVYEEPAALAQSALQSARETAPVPLPREASPVVPREASLGIPAPPAASVTTPRVTPNPARASQTAPRPAPQTSPRAAQNAVTQPRAAQTTAPQDAPAVTPAEISASSQLMQAEQIETISAPEASPAGELANPAQLAAESHAQNAAELPAQNAAELPVQNAAQAMRPLFPAPQNMLPANGYRLSAEQVKQSRVINFSWSAVEGANSYILTILKEGTAGIAGSTLRPERIFQTEISGDTQKYTFNNFRLLDNNGTYIWQLEAISYNSDDIIERRGRTGESKFIMDVKRPGRVRVKELGTLYGIE